MAEERGKEQWRSDNSGHSIEKKALKRNVELRKGFEGMNYEQRRVPYQYVQSKDERNGDGDQNHSRR
jgi:hypothetical protein